MAYSSTTGAKYGLKAITGGSLISDIDSWAGDFRDGLEAIIATADSGPLSSRPTSTSGTPGKYGRFYYATNVDADLGRLFFDYGTGWLALQTYQDGVAASLPAVGPKGALYRATDASRAWIGTGTGWLELAIAGGGTAGKKSIITTTQAIPYSALNTWTLAPTPDRVTIDLQAGSWVNVFAAVEHRSIDATRIEQVDVFVNGNQLTAFSARTVAQVTSASFLASALDNTGGWLTAGGTGGGMPNRTTPTTAFVESSAGTSESTDLIGAMVSVPDGATGTIFELRYRQTTGTVSATNHEVRQRRLVVVPLAF